MKNIFFVIFFSHKHLYRHASNLEGFLLQQSFCKEAENQKANAGLTYCQGLTQTDLLQKSGDATSTPSSQRK